VTFLKNLAVSLFSFFLFLSLTIFGFAFAVKSTALNPDFVTAELNRLEISSLVREVVQIENPPGQLDLNKIINQTISDLEPKIKEEAGSAIHSVYDYLLGRTPEPHLALTLRKTFLSTDFVTPLVNSIDLPALAGPFLSQYFAEALPIEIPNLDKYVSSALSSDEPALKKQVIAVSDPVFDYLLGISPTLRTSISLEPVKESLRNQLLPLYQEFTNEIPTTYTIDESVIQPELRTDISQGIATAEEGLGQAKQYITYFQQGYTLLLVFMGLLVIGIILIVRNVKDIAHRLGVPLVTYGALEYAGIWATKYLISSGKWQFPDMPTQLQTWLFQFINNVMRPLEIFSLGLLIGGAVLVVISFLYKPNKDLTWS
jgi:hypothetical protein